MLIPISDELGEAVKKLDIESQLSRSCTSLSGSTYSNKGFSNVKAVELKMMLLMASCRQKQAPSQNHFTGHGVMWFRLRHTPQDIPLLSPYGT